MKAKKGSVNLIVIGGLLVISLPRFLFNGKQKRIFLGVPDTPINRRGAEEKIKVIESDIAFENFDYSLNKYIRKIPIEIEEISLIDLWDKYTEFKSRLVSNTTLKKDFGKVRNHIKKLPTQQIKDARKIRDYWLKSLSMDTCRRLFMYLSACCEWGKKEELIQKNYFKGIFPQIRKTHEQINPFSQSERDTIISAFSDHPNGKHYTNFVKFLFFTGCRTSEAIGLEWKNIDKDFTKITFSQSIVLKEKKGTKTGKIRSFPINNQLKEVLLDQKRITGHTQYVFLSPKELIIDPHNFSNKYWKPIVSQVVEYRPFYHTRHTFITICLQEGIQVTQIARWCGNSAKTIWEHYAGLTHFEDVPEF